MLGYDNRLIGTQCNLIEIYFVFVRIQIYSGFAMNPRGAVVISLHGLQNNFH